MSVVCRRCGLEFLPVERYVDVCTGCEEAFNADIEAEKRVNTVTQRQQLNCAMAHAYIGAEREDTMTLREQLNGVRLVIAYNDARLTLAWHGGHGIHIYNDAGTEVGYFMVDGSKTNAAVADVRAAMRNYIKDN